MSKAFGIFVLVVLLMIPIVASVEAQDPERDALMALYESTGGENWWRSDGWGVGDPCGDPVWQGVSCNSSGSVTELSLSYNKLTGSVPPEIANLSYLTGLDLIQNSIRQRFDSKGVTHQRLSAPTTHHSTLHPSSTFLQHTQTPLN